MTLYAFDLDGTLLEDGAAVVAPGTLLHLQKLKALGHQIALITGRLVTPAGLLETLQPHAWALGNGNRIFVGGTCVQQHPLSPEDVQVALALAAGLSLEPVGSAVTERPINFVADPGDPRWARGRRAGQIFPFSDASQHEVLHLMFMGEDAPLMRDCLLGTCRPWTVVGGIAPYLQCVNVYAPQAAKHHALRDIALHLGIPMEDVIAFGDSDNDLEMLRVAGKAVQVGTMPYLKEVCQEQVSCPLVGLPKWLEGHIQRLKTPALNR